MYSKEMVREMFLDLQNKIPDFAEKYSFVLEKIEELSDSCYRFVFNGFGHTLRVIYDSSLDFVVPNVYIRWDRLPQFDYTMYYSPRRKHFSIELMESSVNSLKDATELISILELYKFMEQPINNIVEDFLNGNSMDAIKKKYRFNG